MDASTRDTSALNRLRESGRLASANLLRIGDILGRPDADIEDIFEPETNLQMVSIAYAHDLPAPLTTSQLPTTQLSGQDPRIRRRVERHFAEHRIAGGRFNHFRPAAAMLRTQSSIGGQFGDATLARAELLMLRLNMLLS